MPERFSLAGPGRAAVALAVAAAAGFALARPLWVRVGGAPGIGRNLEPSASGFDQLTVFGLFFFLALAWWLAAATAGRGPRLVRWAVVAAASLLLAWLAVRRPDWFLACGVVLFLVAFFALSETRDDRLAIGFVASAFFLVLFCQRLYIYDRMNTFFKLYLEAWLLFAIATAVLVFRGARAPGGDRRLDPAGPRGSGGPGDRGGSSRPRPPAARRVSRHFAPYSGPSLDGLRYLETAASGRIPRRRLAAPHRRGDARAARGAGPVVPGLRPHLDADGPAHGARLGLPRQAARQLRDGDRDAPAGGQGHLLGDGRVAGRALSQALRRRLRLRRVARAQDLPRRGPPEVPDREGALRARLREPGDADLPRRRRTGAGRAPARQGEPARGRGRGGTAPGRARGEALHPGEGRRLGAPVREPARAPRRRGRRARPRLGRRLRPLPPAHLRRRRAARSAAGAAAAAASSASRSCAASRSRATRCTSPTRGTAGSRATRSRACCAPPSASCTGRAASRSRPTAASG